MMVLNPTSVHSKEKEKYQQGAATLLKHLDKVLPQYIYNDGDLKYKNDTEDFFPMYYSHSANSVEHIAHSSTLRHLILGQNTGLL